MDHGKNSKRGVKEEKERALFVNIFCGIKYLDSVLCSYPHENIDIIKDEEIRE